MLGQQMNCARFKGRKGRSTPPWVPPCVRNRYRRRIAKPKSRPIFCAIASLIQTMAIGSR